MQRSTLSIRCRQGTLACAVAILAVLPLLQPTRASAARPAAHSGARTVLTFDTVSRPDEMLVVKNLVATFEKAHPDITISIQPVAGDYVQKEFIKAAAGTLGDLMYTADVFTIPFGFHHVIANMQPYINADPSFNVDDIYPVMLNLGRYPGDAEHGLYMIPQESDAQTLFYNKALFKAAGVPFPTANWTYAQFLADAQKLTKHDASGKTVQWGVSLSDTFWAHYVPFMVAAGGGPITADGRHSNFSAPGSIAGIQTMADLYVKYKVAVPPLVSYDFTSGKVAMAFGQRPNVPLYRQAISGKFDWDVTAMPSYPSGKRVTSMGTQGFAFSANSPHKKEAFQFIAFLASPAGQRVFASTYASVPIRKSLADDASWRKLPGPPYNNDAFVSAIVTGITPPVYPVDISVNCGTVYTGQIGTAETTAMDKIVRGAPVAPTLTALDQQINSCINSVSTQ